jgi:hypothetical protein
MLNLTETAITLILESDETTTIEPSGYVARVETARREEQMVLVSRPEKATLANILKARIPIIEEAPREIHFQHFIDGACKKMPSILVESEELILVTRDVAEAAATLKHPLWRRMVWCDSPETEQGRDCRRCGAVCVPISEHSSHGTHWGHGTQCDGGPLTPSFEHVVGHYALHRVPQGGNGLDPGIKAEFISADRYDDPREDRYEKAHRLAKGGAHVEG